jgi:MtN3 and saliva related transmembrane protein
MDITNLIGYVAATTGAVLMLPQTIKSWRSRRVDELSMGTIALYVLNCALWMVYGGLVHSGPILLANGCGLLIGGCQMVLKLRF